MCGITAIFSYHYASPIVDHEELRCIRDSMKIRGPDGAGEWFSDDGRVGLGHRRLSIIDLSDRASQPMSTPDGKCTITFNGEIYNYKYLRRQLEGKGYIFRSDSDTEVLLYLYQEKGDAFVHDLRGMFAFALWDESKQMMLLARDPYGIKPLYYADDGWCVRAASQVKALLTGGRVSRTPEPAGIVGFFLLGSVPEPYTTYLMIRAVPAGSIIWIDSLGASAPKRYFNIATIFSDSANRKIDMPEHEVFSHVRDVLLDSVRHHMVADVPVGAFLSAGIDSGALVGLVRDVGIEDLQTVTLAFEEYKNLHDDEAPLAEEVAQHYSTDHTSRMLGMQEFNNDLDRILDVMDQPSIDGVNTYFVSKAASERGLKVALSGLGGDELFGGYNSFTDIPRWVRHFRIPSHIPFIGDCFRWLYTAIMKNWMDRSPKAAGVLKYGGSYHGAYFLRRGIYMPWELTSFLDKDLVKEGLARLQLLKLVGNAIDPDPGTPFGRVAALEASLYMRNQLLRDTDWAGMAHSMELRVPLVDAKLLQELAPILIKYAPVHRKQLLVKSPSKLLPEHICKRPKTGFQVPVNVWLETNPNVDSWKRIPELKHPSTPWARRWAYTVMDPILSTI